MLDSTQQFVNILDANGIKYESGDAEAGRDVISVKFKGDNIASIPVVFIFDSDCKNAAIRVFDLVKFSGEQLGAIMKAVCDANERYRFAKFCIDHDDNSVQMEMDAAFRSHDVGEICYDLLSQSVNICDEVYKDFMAALWS